MIIVYSKPRCEHCNIAKAWLTKYSIPFHTIDINEDEKAKAFVIEQGHRTVPQIYWDDQLLVEGGAAGLVSMSLEELAAKIASLQSA